MEPQVLDIFPYIIPPLFSLLTCIFLPLFARRVQGDTPDIRWFSLLCVLTFIFNLYPIAIIFLPAGNPIIGLTRFFFPLASFILPLTIELAHHHLGLRRPMLTSVLYILAMLMTGIVWIGHPPALMWAFTVLNSLVLLYCTALLLSARRKVGRSTRLLFGGMTIMIALCTATFIPLSGFMHYPALCVAFIPLSLIAIGLVQGIEAPGKRGYIKREIIGSIGLSFVGLALCVETTLLMFYLDQINAAAFWDWILPYGGIVLFSLFACVMMAIFSVGRNRTEPGAIPFALCCLVWSLNNLQDVLLVIFPEAIAVQAATINDSYIVLLPAFLAHLIYIQTGRPNSRGIPVFYAFSFILLPLILFKTHGSHIIYQYSSGPFIKAEGVVYDLFALQMLGALLLGVIRSIRVRRSTADPIIRRQAFYLLLASLLATFLLLGTVPCMYGFPIYPFQQLVFIPFILIAYGLYYKGILNLQTRRIMIARLVRTMLILGYIITALLTMWVLRGYDGIYILDKLIPYGIPPLLSFLCAAFISLFVLGLEQSRPETFLFSLLCFFYGGLNLDITLAGIVADPQMALQISRLNDFFLCIFLLGGFLNFVWLVTHKKHRWWLVYLAYVIGLSVAPFAFSHYFSDGVYRYAWGFASKGSILADLMKTIWGGGMVYGMALIWRASNRAEHPDQKTALRHLLLGFGCLTCLTATNIPSSYGYAIYPLGTFIFIPLIFMAYGLFRRNVFMAIQNVRRLLALTLQLAIIVAVAIMVQGNLHPVMDIHVLYIGIVTAFLLYRPVQAIVNLVLNLLIRSARDDLKRQYYALTQKLSQIYRINQIQEVLSQWFFEVLMNGCSVILIHHRDRGIFEGPLAWNPHFFSGIFAPAHQTKDAQTITIAADHPLISLCHQDIPLITSDIFEGWIHTQGIATEEWLSQTEIIVPIFLQEKLTAMVLLSGRIDGFAYSRDEQQILHDLGPILGPNIENARLMEGLMDEVERRTEDLNLALIDSLVKEKEITESNEIITRQNEIFRSLLETSSQIHQIWKLDELFSFTLQHIHSLYKELGFGIILEGGRPDVLESVSFIGISEREQDIILQHRDRLLDPDIQEILNSEMRKRGALDTFEKDAPSWTVIPMLISTQRMIGKTIVKGDPDQATREVITVFLGQVSAVTQGKLLMRELERIASTDGLTGVFNRSYFNQEHLQSVVNATRYRIPFAILMVDVNGLKAVNDQFGHEKGDEMIIKVAHLLRDACRKTDVVARIGGDEFAALMPSTTLEQAQSALARLRTCEVQIQMLCKHKDGEEETVPVRISCGLAASDEIPADDVFKEADKRMYLDKDTFYTTQDRYR